MNRKTPDKNNSNNSSKNKVDELKERVKELNCLYGLTNIVKDKTLTTNEALKKIINLIPPAWQYPEITCARITIDKNEYKTNNLKETKWNQISNIIVDDRKIGVLEVYYLKEKPTIDEGPFLNDERRLIDAIADLLGRYIGENRIKEELEQQRIKLDYAEKFTLGGGRGETTLDTQIERKQDWEVMIELLIKTDPRTLLRLTRKMTYYLYRYENEKITALLSRVCPVDKSSSSQWCGINMPNPRQDLDSLRTIQKQIFQIAKENMLPEEISRLFQNWMKQDKARPLLLASQKEGISLLDITNEINRFYTQDSEEITLVPEDNISIKTALIRRFFTNRPEYVNVAKTYIEPIDFVSLLTHTVGPTHGSGKLGGKTSGIFLAEKILKKHIETTESLKDISHT